VRSTGSESPPAAATLSASAGVTKLRRPSECRLERLVEGLITAVDVENVVLRAWVVKHAGEESGEVVPRDLTAERRGGDAYLTSPAVVCQSTRSYDRLVTVTSCHGSIGLAFSAQINGEDVVAVRGFSTPMPLSIT
jgi:hypothetical protein